MTLLDSLVRRWRNKTASREQMHRLLMIIDELPNTAPVPGLRRFVGEGRGLGINLVAAVQASDQLETVYGSAYANELRAIFPAAVIMHGAREEELLTAAEQWSGLTNRRAQSFGQSDSHKTISSDLGAGLRWQELLPPDRGAREIADPRRRGAMRADTGLVGVRRPIRRGVSGAGRAQRPPQHRRHTHPTGPPGRRLAAACGRPALTPTATSFNHRFSTINFDRGSSMPFFSPPHPHIGRLRAHRGAIGDDRCRGHRAGRPGSAPRRRDPHHWGTTFPSVSAATMASFTNTFSPNLVNVPYPAQLAPFSGDISLGTSVAAGAATLVQMIQASVAATGSIVVWGISQERW